MFQLAILLLQVTALLLKFLQERRLIDEGKRQQIQLEMEKAAKAAALSVKIREVVGKLTDDEVDAALRGDYRD